MFAHLAIVAASVILLWASPTNGMNVAHPSRTAKVALNLLHADQAISVDEFAFLENLLANMTTDSDGKAGNNLSLTNTAKKAPLRGTVSKSKPTKGSVPKDTIMLQGTTSKSGRKILFGTIMIKDTNTQWSPHSHEQPDWVQGILNRNTEILRSFGHKMVLRESTGPVPLTLWQYESCMKRSLSENECLIENQRENANWEKEKMMSQYLQEPGLTHVMILDADAVLTQTQMDTLVELADLLDKEGKDMLYTDEDWHKNGAKRLNGGLLFAKVSNFSKQYYGALVESHQEGPSFKSYSNCSTCLRNEQLCIQSWMNHDCLKMSNHFIWGSSIKYNFHPQVWIHGHGRFPINPSTANRSLFDPTLHVIHFMGASKGVAAQILAELQGEDLFQLKKEKEQLVQMETRTCNDGKSEIRCFDVEKCASSAPKDGKYAFVLTNDLSTPLRLPLPNFDAMKYVAKMHNIDIVMLLPRRNVTKNVTNFPNKNMISQLEEQGIKLKQVPWLLPPKMRHIPTNEHWGPKHFMRFHTFALLDYDAVAFYEDDIEIQLDVVPTLQCAAQGYFLSTSGPLAPLNMGFFAVKPSRPLMQTTMMFAKEANFDYATGWDGAGYLPHADRYASAEVGPGFLHTLLYKKSPSAMKAMKQAGLHIQAEQIDYCTWNYQGQCPTPHFPCGNIRANHHGGGASCWKYGASLHKFFDLDII